MAIGAQCKGERHELTIGRQREALNELRARIKSLEQLRPANPSYEKVLQQVVLLKRELAELRARQALPSDLPYLLSNGSSPHPSHKPPTTTQRQSSSGSIPSEVNPDGQQMVEERTAHAETLNSLRSCDDLVRAKSSLSFSPWHLVLQHTTFTRKLVQLLEIDDDSLLNVTPLASTLSADRYVALQQRQRTIEILLQKIGVRLDLPSFVFSHHDRCRCYANVSYAKKISFVTTRKISASCGKRRFSFERKTFSYKTSK